MNENGYESDEEPGSGFTSVSENAMKNPNDLQNQNAVAYSKLNDTGLIAQMIPKTLERDKNELKNLRSTKHELFEEEKKKVESRLNEEYAKTSGYQNVVKGIKQTFKSVKLTKEILANRDVTDQRKPKYDAMRTAFDDIEKMFE